MKTVDMRSDTITRPTDSMRKAMAEAEVGDDVFGEDPTVNMLEDMAARRLGKEAGLFVASGTMGNLVCQMAHCGRGDEMIVGDQNHIFYYEQGGSAAVAGIHSRCVPNEADGALDLQKVERAIRPDNIHFPVTRLVVVENTHNRCDGRPVPPAYMHRLAEIVRRRDVRIHVDGARLFNAARALGVKARELAEKADSVSVCLSKGLSAPAGSVVCGAAEFVEKARRARKVLGGGMRQAGVLAAAGIVALTEMVERLVEDHANAKRLARGLAAIDGVLVDPANIETNIVYFGIEREGLASAALCEALARRGVKILPTEAFRARAVTHRHIGPDDVDIALEVFREVLG